MEQSFERLLKIGESIALIHGGGTKGKNVSDEKCLSGYFDSREKEKIAGINLKSNCVEILNEPGLFCCLDRWFDEKGSSKFVDAFTLEEIDPATQQGKIAVVYPGQQRFDLASLKEHIDINGWINPITRGALTFYMVIRHAERTQTNSGTGLPSVTDNQDSRGTYSFKGSITQKNGKTLEGHFKNLHLDGERVVFSSKDCTEMHGDKTSYTGDWLDGYWHGKGVLYDFYGSVYRGEFEKGTPAGKGIVYWSDGSVYKGQWLNGKRNGEGIQTYEIGGVYNGQWLDNKRHGEGTMEVADGGVYKGQWRDDNRHGEGTMEYTDGGVYKGQWLNNMYSKGTMEYANGNVYKGQWLNNKNIGEGTMEYKSGNTYKGQWLNNKRNGEGTMEYADGGVYKGQWLNDLLHGQGAIKYPGESKFTKGTWENNTKVLIVED